VSPTLDAGLRSWVFDPWLLGAMLTIAGVYFRGWRKLGARWNGGHLCAFLGGLSTIYLALASPIDPFADLLLQVHMLQHALLMMVAPPLLWLGAPLFPLLRGLPEPVRAYWVAPLFRSPALRVFFTRLTHPAAALSLFIASTWLWHIPAAYEIALRSDAWHYLEHACFVSAGLLFWYPVIRPYPSRPRWSLWLLLPYLFLADLQNTAFSALLTFSNRVLYPHYLQVPRLGGLSALDDQSAAGVLMWVPGSLVFLLPLFVIAFRLLHGQGSGVRGQGSGVRGQRSEVRGQSPEAGMQGRITLPVLTGPALTSDLRPLTSDFDLLRVSLVGRFLKWRHSRLTMQLPLLGLACVVIWDGLRGPHVGAMNLAGVLPWIHWRGLVILSLLAAGNFFCMACPFLVPRTVARRWLPKGRSWPRLLRSKWLAVVLLGIFLWAYEAFSLWDSPWWTAWLAISYFVAALIIDGYFRGAAFCKYVCPIGQFNFVQSLISPLEVKVREPEICATCETKDCIRGRDGIPGCELHLFQPRKAGNMDCTFCLDCIHACPHDNIAMPVRTLGSELWHHSPSSGVGALARRPDLAALVVVLVFGAFTNAAGMVAPVAEWQDRLAAMLGQASPFLSTSVFYFLGLVVLPALTVGAAAMLSRRWGRLNASALKVATRYSFALVPLGFSMWLAHYSFHFLTSYDTVIPTAQRFIRDIGWSGMDEPLWVAACCRPVADWLPHLEILFLDLGFLLSLYTGCRISLSQSPRLSRALAALAPWAALITFLFALGVWLVLQPMQMRGTFEG
jgi:cytochrome c oxidase assembly factor CtaG/ferredoxin